MIEVRESEELGVERQRGRGRWCEQSCRVRVRSKEFQSQRADSGAGRGRCTCASLRIVMRRGAIEWHANSDDGRVVDELR